MKYLFFPLAAHGHVNPMLAVAQELVLRGDEVIFYVTREFDTAVRSTGASLRLLDDRFNLPAVLPGGGNESKLMPRLLGMVAHGLREIPYLVQDVRKLQADCIVYDPKAVWGRSIASALELPTVIFRMTFGISQSPTLQRLMKKTRRAPPSPRTILAMLKLLWTSEMLHRRHGLPRLRMNDAVADLNIIPLPRQYQPDADLFDERFLFIGPSIARRNDRGDFPLEKLEGRPVLFISLGTILMNQRQDFYAACFKAFGDTRWQVVMVCGKSVDLGPMPSNFLVRQHVPQLDVLERARVFITHGGMNSTMEGLWHGVPLAIFPQVGDGPLNARRVTELGLGASLTAHQATDPKMLSETVKLLDTDPGYRSRLAVFQQALREAGGHRRAVDALQAYAGSRRGRQQRKAV